MKTNHTRRGKTQKEGTVKNKYGLSKWFPSPLEGEDGTKCQVRGFCVGQALPDNSLKGHLIKNKVILNLFQDLIFVEVVVWPLSFKTSVT